MGEFFILLLLPIFSSAAPIKSPDVSADALFLYRNSNYSKEDTSTIRNGIDVQELEVAFMSDVDPYSRLVLTLSLAPQYTLNSQTNRVTQTWEFKPEEAFAESNHVSWTTLRVGKFKAAFGKHNLLHTHDYPLVDQPLINASFFGGEGLNDVGVSAAVLLPFPWFSELTGQYLRGEGENPEFSSPSPNDAVGLGHWKNLWDLTEDLTGELGVSYAQGTNMFGRGTGIGGGDLTFKWRPSVGGKYRSFIIATEFMQRNLEQPEFPNEKGTGIYLLGKFQFAERWHAVLRYENLFVDGANNSINPNALQNGAANRYAGGVAFNATEFSFFRIEYSQTEGLRSDSGLTVERKVYLQANFTIGAHPAHGY